MVGDTKNNKDTKMLVTLNMGANNQNKGLPPDIGLNAGYRKQSRLIA